MGLSFVGGKDKDGAAIYLLHNGSGPQERDMERMKDRLERLGLNHQIYIFSVRDGEGERVRDFYDMQALPCAIIVRDNDQVAYSWNGEMPPAETIAYHARQVSI